MKVGIITYHRAHNYGALLQCYALSSVLKQQGHSVNIIDYYPLYFKEQYAAFSWKKLKAISLKSKISYIVKFISTYSIRRKRVKAFENFIGKLPLTAKQYNENEYSFEEYDAIFFGSDQIWNPTLTFGEDKVFSGNFNKNGAKFIAYAASTSPKLLNEEYERYFNGIIERFDAISTRETSLCEYLNELVTNSAKVVLDPVLLLSKEDWSKIAIKPKEENYLLIYTVPQSDKVWKLATMIAKERNLKIIEIRPNVRVNNKKNILQTVSPEEFLGYFKHASYIVTTSFHGTAFSVKFNKEFATLKLGTHVDDRAKNLLGSIGLEERMVPIDNLQIPQNMIDYTGVEEKLNKLINDSIQFINNTL